MPAYLRGATIDYGFSRRSHAEKRALLPLVQDDIADHTFRSLVLEIERASEAIGGARIDAALHDEGAVDLLVVVENGARTVIGFEHRTADGRTLGSDECFVPIALDEADFDEVQEELEPLGISVDDANDGWSAQLPDAVSDEDAAREAAEAIARLRAERTDSVTVQVATDRGDRLAVTFEGPRFTIAPMQTVATSGDPAHLARFRALSATTTTALLGETFGGTLTFGFPSPIAERIDAWRIAGGSPSQLIAELWTRAYPAIAKLDAATLARIVAPYESASRGKQRASVDRLTHFDMLHEAARLGTKISPLVLYAYVEHGGDALTG